MSRLHDPDSRQVLQRKAHLVTSGNQRTNCRCFFPFKCKQLYVHVWHLYMSSMWYALRNILLRIISGECPRPWGGLRHTIVSASIHKHIHKHTRTHAGTKNTLKDKQRVAFTAQTGTHSHVWTQVCKWSRQSMRSDWLRLRTHTGGSGDRDRRVMMTSSGSVGSWFESCAGGAEPWQTRGGAWGGQGSWPYLGGHAANGV